MFYNTMVALPMSLSLVKDRLEQGYYRQVQGLLGDVAAIQRNATDFNGEDSQVAELAAGMYLSCPACTCLNQDSDQKPLLVHHKLSCAPAATLVCVQNLGLTYLCCLALLLC